MSRNETLRTGLAVLVILVLSGLVTAVWPLLTMPTSSGSGGVVVEPQTIELSLPSLTLPVVGGVGGDIVLTSLQALGIMAAAIIFPVVVAGLVIGIVYRLLDRQATAVKQSETFQANLSTLEQREKERLSQLNNERKTHDVPEHEMPRWSMISTALTYLFFAILVALLINFSFFPDNELDLGEGALYTIFDWLGAGIGQGIVNSSSVILLLTLIIMAPILAWRLRPQQAEELQAVDHSGIPWDSIIVIISGLIVVGLGIGFMLYLNVPG